MNVAEKTAERVLKKVTVGTLQKTMEAEAVDMEQAVGIWRERIKTYVRRHTEEDGWLKNVEDLAAEWIDPDNEDEVAEAVDQAKTGGYIEGYTDGFADALIARAAEGAENGR